MTPKQKANQKRFKEVVAEAKKLRKKNPKLTQAQAVKKAWAIKKGKKVGDYNINKTEFAETRLPYKPRKKTAKKKKVYAVDRNTDGTYKKIRRISGGTHKDTKSHNVNIRVVSGIEKTKFYL